ncbi:MAG: hypothetical protein QG594_1427, partial [Bacteroidota bacterium]|nr:hypothetical protein [Bacteroidota bacterium]
KTSAEINNKKVVTAVKENTLPLTDSQVSLDIKDLELKSENAVKSDAVTGIVNLQFDQEVFTKGMSYELFDNSGKLIKSNPINKINTSINLHNVEAENYVLNIVKGSENLKTFGFYH